MRTIENADMKIESSTVTKLLITGATSLDPITVFLEDFEPGKGKITVSCWGKSWTGSWGAMSGRTVSTFFCDCDAGYIIGYFAPQLYSTRFTGKALQHLASQTIIDRRRGKSLDHDRLDKDEARALFNQIDELGYCESLSEAPDPLMADIFGPEWWLSSPDAQEPNPDYKYLCRIIAAVQQALAQSTVGSSHQ